MGRAPCCDKANVKKGPWSPEEDAKLKSYIEKHGTGGNWIALPQKIGLKRCGKSCRLRWLNYLRPNIKHGGFSEEEDNIICSLYISIGSRWSIIAAQLPGRTDNDIKNYWNTKLKKKLLGKPRIREGRQSAASRRGVAVPEQEPKKLVCESFLVPSQQPPPPLPPQQPCWEHHAPVLPSNSVFDGSQDTIKRLLSKLNGSINPDPIEHYQNDHSLLNTSMVDLASNSLYTDPIFAPFQASGGNWSLSTELEEMLYCNSMKLEGAAGLFDAATSIGTSVGGSSRAAAVGPTVFAPELAADYYQQGVLMHHELGIL